MISWRVVNHPSGRSNLPYENRSKPISGCTPPGAATAAFCHGFTGLRRHLDEILCAAAVSHILLRSETDSDRGSLRKEPRRRVQAKPSSLSRRDRETLWGGRQGNGNFVAACNRWSAAMPQPNDLSR